VNNNIVSKSDVRALILSDLHLELASQAGLSWRDIQPPRPEESNYDVIILAGDIALGGELKNRYDDLLEYFGELNKLDKPVLYVSGNHEYYLSYNFGNLGQFLSQKLDSHKYNNIHLLDRSTFEYKGITFIGATLWTDFDNKNEEEMDKAKASMSDYDFIALPSSDGAEPKKIKPKDIYKEHKKDLIYITEQLEKLDTNHCVVITHHAPVKNDDLTLHLPSAYQSDLNKVIKELKPIAWVHGHIHQSIDKTIVDTRIICNPRGYIAHKRKDSTGRVVDVPAKMNPNFKSDFIANLTPKESK